ncbi:MAG: hypothetical protein H7061_02240 [Bdellovibrionaceae bacterium]|nr:hypothetical protein [Bdellovibrio sp.]
MKIRLFISNFLFQFPVGIVLIHGLFLRSNDQNKLQYAIIASMGVFAALQFGGTWIISWIKREYLMNPHFWMILRIVGGLLYLCESASIIILGAALMGFSQALYYRFTRQAVARIWRESKIQEQMYININLSSNLAFFILPPVGSVLSSIFNINVLMLGSLFLSTIGVYLIFDLLSGDNLKSYPLDSGSKILPNLNGIINKREFSKDVFFLASFVIPYGIMMALIPIRTKGEGLGIDTNALLISFNAVLVIAVLSFKMLITKLSPKTIVFDNKLLYFSLAAWALTIASAFLSFKFLFLSFILWSILEALQLPAIEQHIFSQRNYSNTWIDRLLVVDIVGGLIAPPFAAILSSVARLL